VKEVLHAFADCVPFIVGGAIGIAAVQVPRIVDRWLETRRGIPWVHRKNG
jgi:hypothetical protein